MAEGIKKIDGGRWEVRVVARRRVASFADAVRLRDHLRQAMRDAPPPRSCPIQIALERKLEDLKLHGRTTAQQQTVARHVAALLPYVGPDLDDVTLDKIRDWQRAYIAHGAGRAGQANRYVGSLRSVARLAQEDGVWQPGPHGQRWLAARPLPDRSIPRAEIPADELRRRFAVLPDRLRYPLLLEYYLLDRIGAILQIRLEDVELGRASGRVFLGGQKWGKQSWIQLPEGSRAYAIVADAVAWHVWVRRAKNMQVRQRERLCISDRTGRGWASVQSYGDALRGWQIRQGLTPYTSHQYRHAATTAAFEAGLSVPQVATLRRDKSWASAERYAHLHGAGLDHARRQFETCAPSGGARS